MMPFARSCLAACLIALPGMPQGTQLALEVRSLLPILGRPALEHDTPFGSLLTRMRQQVDFLATDEVEPLSGEHVVEILHRMNEAAVERSKLEIERHGGNLVLRGESAAVAAALQTLDRLTAVAAVPLLVQASLHAIGDVLPPTVLGAEDLARFRASHPSLWSAAAVTRPGGPVALGQSQRVPYVRDINVEIAQRSEAAVPVRDELVEGIALAVAPHTLAASADLVAFVQFAVGQRRDETRTYHTNNRNHPALDQPELDSCFGTAAARIPAGGALAITVSGSALDGPRWTLLVSVRVTAPPPDPDIGGGRLLPVSALASAALGTGSPPPAGTILFDPDPQAYLHDLMLTPDDQQAALGIHALTEMLLAAIGTEELSCDHCGGFLLVRGGREQTAAAERLLAALQDRLLVNDSLRATIASPDAAGPMHQVAMPMLRERTHLLWRGRETTAVGTMNLEVAQQAKIHDPVVQLLQHGLWLRARSSHADPTAHLELLAQLQTIGPIRRRGLDPAQIGDLQLRDVATAQWSHHGPVASGSELDLGDGPTSGAAWTQPAPRLRIRTGQ